MEAIRYERDRLHLLDQTKLPLTETWDTYTEAAQVASAIRTMKVRGAPAIGAAGAFAVAIEASRLMRMEPIANIANQLISAIDMLRQSRPTAVNLDWALNQMINEIRTTTAATDLVDRLYQRAVAIAKADVRVNQAIGMNGATIFDKPVRVLTHCNTGALATVGYGTALGIIRSLQQTSKLRHVYVGETRPYLQGSRLTAYELSHEGIPYDIITDSAAGHLMQMGLVDVVLVGADRVAANGDTANKIGTYSLAVLASYHDIPFYVAAPLSTVDLGTPTGSNIPIEQRAASEITHIYGQQIAPEGATAIHPAFDVTPSELITGIVTEVGVVKPSYEIELPKMVQMGESK